MASTQMNQASPADEVFPIRTVSSLTGVNVITLRAWERRYNLIKPMRTPTGHRLYRRADVDRIHQALALIKRGISISQVSHTLDSPERKNALRSTALWSNYQTQLVNAIASFDEDRLERIYNEILALHPIDTITTALLLPLLVELGRRWETGVGTVAEEHFFAVYLRNKLGARFHHRTRDNTGPRILAACLPGELHEIGLLLFALVAHERTLKPVLLGANTPLRDLEIVAQRARCSGIVLSGSIQLEPDLLQHALPRLVNSAGVPVFVGGLCSILQRDAIVAAGAIPVGNDIPSAVERIQFAVHSVNARN